MQNSRILTENNKGIAKLLKLPRFLPPKLTKELNALRQEFLASLLHSVIFTWKAHTTAKWNYKESPAIIHVMKRLFYPPDDPYGALTHMLRTAHRRLSGSQLITATQRNMIPPYLV